MIAIEFAFLALGLVVGVASGAVLVMLLGRRSPDRHVRLTVSHDAVPRRGATLSTDAFSTAAAEPARGGPADRRRLDRSDGHEEHVHADPTSHVDPDPIPARGRFGIRTTVPFGAPAASSVGIPIEPERDPALDALRVKAAQAAAKLYRADLPAPAVAESLVVAQGAVATATAPVAVMAETAVEAKPDATPALIRILRGDHQALYAITAALAGQEADERRAWETAIRSMTSAIVDRAIGEGWLDFPTGNPFWDTFTVTQCRAIAGALAAAGHRFDGIDGWTDGRIPNYRDLTIAVADAGLEPRRIRAWPTQEEIDDLYIEVTAAPDEYLATNAPELGLEEVQALVGIGGPERARLWSDWDRLRAVFLAPVPTPIDA